MPKSLYIFVAAVLAALGFVQPASAEVIKTSDGFFVTRDAAIVKAAPSEAWQALIAPAKWWDDRHTWSADAENLYISPQAGGCFCELLPVAKDLPEGARRGSAHHMTIMLVDPPKVLRMHGSLGPLQSEPVNGVLTITVNPTAKGTVITFEYVVGGYMRFETTEIAKAVDGVMSQQLRGLAKLLGPAVVAPVQSGTDDKPASDSAADKAEGGAQGAVKDEPETAAKKTQSVEDAFGAPEGN